MWISREHYQFMMSEIARLNGMNRALIDSVFSVHGMPEPFRPEAKYEPVIGKPSWEEWQSELEKEAAKAAP